MYLSSPLVYKVQESSDCVYLIYHDMLASSIISGRKTGAQGVLSRIDLM